MSRSTYVCGILQIILLIGYGCSDEGDAILPPNNGPLPTLSCTPDSGYIGEAFAISGETFEVPALRNVLFFSDSVEKRADSGSSSMIYASVPFGATTGQITLKANQHTYTSKTFRIREMYNPSALNVVWHNLAPAITANDSSVIDGQGIRRTWQATVSHDTIHIRRSHSFFEGYAEYHFLFRNVGANDLPQLITSWVFFEDDTHQRSWDTLSVGIMKVQNWDTAIALSGRFISRPYGWGPFTFWVSANNISP